MLRSSLLAPFNGHSLQSLSVKAIEVQPIKKKQKNSLFIAPLRLNLNEGYISSSKVRDFKIALHISVVTIKARLNQ